MSMKWLMENSSQTKARLLKGASAALLAVSLAVTSGCSLLPKEAEEEQLPSITPPQISQKPVYEVTTTTLETKVSGSGKLMSLQEETLYTTLEGKRVKELYVAAGDTVESGQLVAQLDVEDLEKSLRAEQLQFRRDENRMKETLRKRDEMEPSAFEEEMIAFEEKRQRLADLQEEIGKANIYASFTGTVVSVNVMKGDQIKAYDPIAIIADTTRLTLAVQLNKTSLAQVAVGMPAVVEISNKGQFQGEVKVLPIPSTDDGNGSNPGTGGNANKPERIEDFLIVDIGELPEGLTRGMPIYVNIITKRKENAVVIPSAALRTIGSRNYVQVEDEQGKREVDVAVGQTTSTQVEILEGLKPGQKVVGR